MKTFKLILLSFFYVSCVGQTKQDLKKKNITSLAGTRWEFHLAEQYIDFFLFDKEPCGYQESSKSYKYCTKEGYYTNYNSEMDYPFSGKYEIKNDTVYLTEVDLISELPKNNEIEIKSFSKMILTDKGLIVIYTKRRDANGWEERWIKEPNMFFQKIEN